MEAGGFVQPQTHFSVNLSDFQPVHIFQSKECVHKTKVAVYIRHVDCPWTDIKDVSHFFDEIEFGFSGFGFVLRYTDIRGLSEKAENFTELFFVSCFSDYGKSGFACRLP